MLNDRQKIIDKCVGCNKVNEGFCSAYLFPSVKWRLGNCLLASHVEIEVDKTRKERVGQKKGRRKKK